MRWPSAWLVASSAALVLSGCGSSSSPPPKRPPPPIPAAIAQRLAAEADAVAAQQGCAARVPAAKLLADVIASEGQIPSRYQEPLTSAANDLVSSIPPCPKHQPPEHGKGHGKHKGHDKHGGDDNDQG